MSLWINIAAIQSRIQRVPVFLPMLMGKKLVDVCLLKTLYVDTTQRSVNFSGKRFDARVLKFRRHVQFLIAAEIIWYSLCQIRKLETDNTLSTDNRNFTVPFWAGVAGVRTSL